MARAIFFVLLVITGLGAEAGDEEAGTSPPDSEEEARAAHLAEQPEELARRDRAEASRLLEIQRLEARHRAEMAALEKGCEDQLATMRRSHESALEQLRRDNARQLAEAREREVALRRQQEENESARIRQGVLTRIAQGQLEGQACPLILELLQIHGQELSLQRAATQELASGVQRLLGAFERLAERRGGTETPPPTAPGTPRPFTLAPVMSRPLVSAPATPRPSAPGTPPPIPGTPRPTAPMAAAKTAEAAQDVKSSRAAPRRRCMKCSGCKAALAGTDRIHHRRIPCESWTEKKPRTEAPNYEPLAKRPRGGGGGDEPDGSGTGLVA